MFKMVLVKFQIEDKLERAQFFQKTFLLADTSIEIILGMSFLTLSNVNMQFAERELIWQSYTPIEALPTIK